MDELFLTPQFLCKISLISGLQGTFVLVTSPRLGYVIRWKNFIPQAFSWRKILDWEEIV